MHRIRGKVLPCNILTILTAIAVMGSFSLAAMESLRAAGLTAGQDGLSNEAYYFFPEQTEDAAMLAHSDDDRNSTLRMDSHRVFNSWGLSGPEHTFCLLRVLKNSKNGFVSTKDTIILKLRI